MYTEKPAKLITINMPMKKLHLPGTY